MQYSTAAYTSAVTYAVTYAGQGLDTEARRNRRARACQAVVALERELNDSAEKRMQRVHRHITRLVQDVDRVAAGVVGVQSWKIELHSDWEQRQLQVNSISLNDAVG